MTMAIDKGSPAELAVANGWAVGAVIECPAGRGAVQRFRVTGVGEYHVLARRCGFKGVGRDWAPRYGEGMEELLWRQWLEAASKVE